jgi:YbbR domain-containing protein
MIVDKLIQPKEILVTGNQEALDKLVAISTVKQSINNLTADVTMQVMLDLPEGIQLVNANEQINAIIEIQKVITNTIDISNIEYKNLDQKYLVSNAVAKTVRLTLRGPEELLKDAQNNITLYVDLTNAKEGIATYEILVNKSPMLEVLDIEPKNIGLDIRMRE